VDTNDYPSLPNLAQVHARLAANSRRVEAVVDSQLGEFGPLLDASIREDWPAVAQAARSLAELGPELVGAEVLREARCVIEELSGAMGPLRRPKHLSSLLTACRGVKQRPERF
jgi:hypothetical protein